MSTSLVEPDYSQVGDLYLSLKSRQNARAVQRASPQVIIKAVPGPNEQITKLKHTGRLVSYRIESNELGGYYEAGAPLFHWQPSDGRRED